jgi:hypothetical protein
MAYIQGWQWIGHTKQIPTQAARAAYRLVHSHLRKGCLVRPDTCEECGGSRRRIAAAHSDYSQPLAIRWLCTKCHNAWDRAEPKGGSVKPRVYRACVQLPGPSLNCEHCDLHGHIGQAAGFGAGALTKRVFVMLASRHAPLR